MKVQGSNAQDFLIEKNIPSRWHITGFFSKKDGLGKDRLHRDLSYSKSWHAHKTRRNLNAERMFELIH